MKGTLENGRTSPGGEGSRHPKNFGVGFGPQQGGQVPPPEIPAMEALQRASIALFRSCLLDVGEPVERLAGVDIDE